MSSLPPQLEIASTGDGSPTIAYKRADGYLEKMHHSGGAFSESLYIYHHGLKLALDKGCPPRVLSLGTGLGYNELIALAEFHHRNTPDFKIWSFEADAYLREEFRKFLLGENIALGEAYNKISRLVCEHFKIAHQQFIDFARTSLNENRLELRGAFPLEAKNVSAGILFYDAFSNKMSPELWVEDEMRATLQSVTAPSAVLCTYAATGAMNRVLKNLGFQLLDRAGFQGKRESTLAIRKMIT